MTAGLLGVDDQGNHDAGSTPTTLSTNPGYDDEWYDLKSKSFVKA